MYAAAEKSVRHLFLAGTSAACLLPLSKEEQSQELADGPWLEQHNEDKHLDRER